MIIPPALVVYHRWLMHPTFESVLSDIWTKSPLLKQISLPTYFLIIIPLFLVSVYCFYLLVVTNKIGSPESLNEITGNEIPPVDIPRWQVLTGSYLHIVAGIGLVVAIIISISQQAISGIEILGIAFLYIIGLSLKEIKLERITQFIQRNTGWVIAFLAVYSSVLTLLHHLFGEQGQQLSLGAILVFLIAVITVRWYRKIPVIMWISLLALSPLYLGT